MMEKASRILAIIGLAMIGIASAYPLLWTVVFNTFENGIGQRLIATALLGCLFMFAGCFMGLASTYKD